MPEAKSQVSEKPEYHGPDRRKSENEQMRRFVEAQLIAHERIQERERVRAEEMAEVRKKERKSLFFS